MCCCCCHVSGQNDAILPFLYESRGVEISTCYPKISTKTLAALISSHMPCLSLLLFGPYTSLYLCQVPEKSRGSTMKLTIKACILVHLIFPFHILLSHIIRIPPLAPPAGKHAYLTHLLAESCFTYSSISPCTLVSCKH